ncbi:MAG: hypothetical protein HFH68_01570 [Lachnospiraceae bacterium]|nr:hypothetical protein [Lachnospiraceae bacterium]
MSSGKMNVFGNANESLHGKTVELSSRFKDMTYDAHFKKVFSIRRILAIVIKETIDIFASCEIDDIENLICDVRDDIVQVGTESSIDGEAAVKFDILVTVRIPSSLQKILLYKFVQIKLDLEMQRKFYLEYVLSKRGLYYASRQVSEQLTVVSDDTNYDSIMPVYSIWITLVHHGNLSNKILKYQIRNTSNDSIDRSKRPVVRMDEITQMFNIFFICIDESVLVKKEVVDGLEAILEFLSLMFAGQFYDKRFEQNHDVKFKSVVDKHKKEMMEMAAYLTEIERERVESEKRGEERGEKRGKLLGTVNTLFLLKWSVDDTIAFIEKEYNLTEEQARGYIKNYLDGKVSD